MPKGLAGIGQIPTDPDPEFDVAKSFGVVLEGRNNVFHVDDQTLERIDALEQHPDWYERIQIPITLSHGAIQEAWIYLMPHGQYDNMPCIDSGDWSLR